MRRAIVILTALLIGCTPLASARPAQNAGAKPYSRDIYVADPEPGVRCYIAIDGAPAGVAISCLTVSR